MTTRNELDAKLNQQGYAHPTEVNGYHPQTSTYMSYSDGGDYKPQTYDPYSVFNADEKEPHMSIKNIICPVCSEKALYSCNCALEDMLCGKGHTWYFVKGQVVIANPHENDDD